MKEQKTTIILTATLSGIMLILALVFEINFSFINIKSSTYQSVAIGLMTSSTVSLLLTLVSYFREKNILLEHTLNILTGAYINLSVIKDFTGKLLVETPDINAMNKELKFIESLIDHTAGLSDNARLVGYAGFFNKVIPALLKESGSFFGKVKNLKSIFKDLVIIGLEYENVTLDIKGKKLNGTPYSPDDISKAHASYQKAIIVKLSKLHEYEASLVIEAEQLLPKTIKNYKGKIDWLTYKSNLDKEIEETISVRKR